MRTGANDASEDTCTHLRRSQVRCAPLRVTVNQRDDEGRTRENRQLSIGDGCDVVDMPFVVVSSQTYFIMPQ